MSYRDCFTGLKELLKNMKRYGMKKAVITMEYIPIVEVFEEGTDIIETEKPAFEVFLNLAETPLEELKRFEITEERQSTLKRDSTLNVIASPEVCFVMTERLSEAIKSVESDLKYLQERYSWYDLPEFEFRRVGEDSIEIRIK